MPGGLHSAGTSKCKSSSGLPGSTTTTHPLVRLLRYFGGTQLLPDPGFSMLSGTSQQSTLTPYVPGTKPSPERQLVTTKRPSRSKCPNPGRLGKSGCGSCGRNWITPGCGQFPPRNVTRPRTGTVSGPPRPHPPQPIRATSTMPQAAAHRAARPPSSTPHCVQVYSVPRIHSLASACYRKPPLDANRQPGSGDNPTPRFSSTQTLGSENYRSTAFSTSGQLAQLTYPPQMEAACPGKSTRQRGEPSGCWLCASSLFRPKRAQAPRGRCLCGCRPRRGHSGRPVRLGKAAPRQPPAPAAVRTTRPALVDRLPNEAGHLQKIVRHGPGGRRGGLRQRWYAPLRPIAQGDDAQKVHPLAVRLGPVGLGDGPPQN